MAMRFKIPTASFAESIGSRLAVRTIFFGGRNTSWPELVPAVAVEPCVLPLRCSGWRWRSFSATLPRSGTPRVSLGHLIKGGRTTHFKQQPPAPLFPILRADLVARARLRQPELSQNSSLTLTPSRRIIISLGVADIIRIGGPVISQGLDQGLGGCA